MFWSGDDGDIIEKQEHVKHTMTYRIITLGSAVDDGDAVVASTTYTAPAGLIDKQKFKTAVRIAYNNASQPMVAGEGIHVIYNRDVTGEASSYSGDCIVYRWQASFCSDNLST